ncbi:MAG TPA: hypothetical protein VN931_05935 [Fibrobacteria bacterium]|nr:hypothetical protein [Fibrobacteria bacterium]
MSAMGRVLPLLALLAAGAGAEWSAAPLGAFAVATLADQAVVARLQARFHAGGTPVFLLGSPVSGLQQGDILRFSDKAFLVDADVWQTLSAEGALRALRQSPVVRVQAAANPAAWNARSRIVSSAREKKLYEFGAALLKSLQQSMGGVPTGQKLFLSLEGGQLVLTAPASFLDRLRAGPSASSQAHLPRGRPEWVSTPPPDSLWVGQKLTWTAWAVDDSGGPTTDFAFGYLGNLPAGLVWDKESRSLQGDPLDTGHSSVRWTVVGERGGDTLAWHPVVRRPQPPRLEGQPIQPRCGGNWSFTPVPWSSRWPGSALHVVPVSLPAGARWDSAAGSVAWSPPDSGPAGAKSVCGATVDLGFRVVDPTGASASRTWTVRVQRRKDLISSDGLLVQLPWDTLLERRWYTWNPGRVRSDWEDAGVSLDSVRGDGDVSWNGSVLSFRPTRVGRMDFVFVFAERGAKRAVEVSKPVKAYLPPVFLSRLGGSGVADGSVRSYRPVALDPQGGPVHVFADIPPGAPLAWDGRDLVATPDGPGAWAARLEARDTLDQIAEQWVEFHSQANPNSVVAVRHRWEAGTAPWEAEMSLGSGRIGLFVPDLDRLLGWTSLVRQDWPFVYGGMDFLGPDQRRKGNSLGGDLGFTLRVPNSDILTGGVMARISATASARPDLPWSFEGEVLAWLNQGILLTDSGGFMKLTQAQVGGGYDSAADARYGKALGEIESDEFDRKNLVVLSRLEGWLHLPWDMGAGIGLWRNDLPIAHEFEQRVGFGLRWRPRTPAGTFSAALRAGWGPAGSGSAVWGDLQWTTGILP